MKIEVPEYRSSFISFVEYEIQGEYMLLTLWFRKYYVESETYLVPPNIYRELISAQSLGKYYLTNIKNKYSQKNNANMADKIIKCKIDVRKINKDWLFTGEKGTYLNFTLMYNEAEDQFGNSGLIIQDVPTEIYKKEKAAKVPKDRQTKGEILGNAKEFNKQAHLEETKPGVESGKMGVEGITDDLPF